MSETFTEIIPEIQDHIKKLVKTAGLEENQESLDILTEGWLEKNRSFMEQTKQFNMEEVDTLNIDDPRGALVLTYSGSLINVGPEKDDVRSVEYVSIGLRHDVPESADTADSVLAKSIELNEAVEFEVGPIQKSSPVYAIAVFREEMETDDEENKLDEVTMMLAQDFADINKTVIQS